MAEEQTYSKNIKFLTSEADQNINDVIRKCAGMRISEINNEKSNEEYIFVSMLVGFMETFVAKFSSEVSGITETIIKNERDKYKALFVNFKARSVSITKQNNDLHKRIDNIEKPEIHEIISKGIDPITIANYLTSVMDLFVKIEIGKCLLLIRTESNNEGPDKEYIPVSILAGLMETLVAKFSSDASVKMAKMISDQEAELDALFVDFEANIKGNTKEKKYLLKQLENIKISKMQGTNSKDAVIDVNKYNGADSKDRKISTFGGKKSCSIISWFANRNKKYEILSTRK